MGLGLVTQAKDRNAGMAKEQAGRPGEDAFRPAIYRLLQVSALMLKTREHYAAGVGVTPPQFSILTAIAERPGTSIGDVAQRLHVTGPFVTAEVNKLVAAGMVAKQSSASDRRVAELTITPTCAERLAAVSPLREAANEKVFAGMGTEDLARFSADLSSLIAGLQDALHMLAKPPGRD